MADWLKILEEQQRIGEALERDVPVVLANPHLDVALVVKLFQALEQQAQFAEKLTATLEALDYDFAVVDAADTLVERYGSLAAQAGTKLKALRV